jgi:hypothetical protein
VGTIKKVPLPMTGLILGLAALGNLIQSYSGAFRSILGLISGLLLVLIIAKLIAYPAQVKEELTNPVVASVFPTFIEQGVDIGVANGDQSGLGGLEALVEAGKLAIGANYDQSEFAPERIPLSVGQSYPLALDYLYSLIIDNKFESKPYEMGVAAGAVTVIYNEAYNLPSEVKTELEKIVNDIRDGKIDVKALVEANK